MVNTSSVVKMTQDQPRGASTQNLHLQGRTSRNRKLVVGIKLLVTALFFAILEGFICEIYPDQWNAIKFIGLIGRVSGVIAAPLIVEGIFNL